MKKKRFVTRASDGVRVEVRDDVDIAPHKGMQEEVLISNADVIVCGGNRGGGKLQDYDSQVLTPFGYRRIGDLNIGDRILNPDGGVQFVKQIHEHGIKDIYELTFADNSKARCGIDHLWQVRKSSSTRKARPREFYGRKPFFDGSVWTTKEIIDFLDKKEKAPKGKTIKAQNLLIPLTKPLTFTRSGLKRCNLHPYLIGVLIGDGYIVNKKALNFTSIDPEIGDRLSNLGYNNKVRKDEKSWVFTENRIYIAEELDKINLLGKYSHDKFIPEYLKYAPIKDRIELVKGLMDTDGYVDDRGHMSYTTVSKRLADDFRWVIKSLGGKATITSKRGSYRDVNTGELVECKIAYTIYFNTTINRDLVFLPRKKDRCRDEFNGGSSTLTMRIESYKYVGKKQCRCITVSSVNSLYITDDFIVTHNSFAIILDILYDIDKAGFRPSVFRKTLEDYKKGGSVWNKGKEIYKLCGGIATDSNYTVKFPSGARVTFGQIDNESKTALERQFQGMEIPAIYLDEANQYQFKTIQKLMECNRNAYGIRNRIVMTCNPDPDSWLATFIDWYIGDNGYIIDDRDRVMRYFYINGDSVDDVVWGNTREEVYLQVKSKIDSLMTPKFIERGGTYEHFIKSFVFIQGDLSENDKLPLDYVANIGSGSEEEVARNLRGNWKVKIDGEEMVKRSDILKLPDIAPQTDGRKRLSIDVALGGSDNCVIVIWDGLHIVDIKAYPFLTPESLKGKVNGLVDRYHIKERDIYYDAVGSGQVLKDFKRAYPVEANAKPIEDTGFDKLKSQIIYQLGRLLQDEKISIDEELFETKFEIGKGSNKIKMSLRDILLQERKLMQIADDETKIKMMTKKQFKKDIGRSPDFIEAIAYGIVHTLYKKKKSGRGIRGLGLL